MCIHSVFCAEMGISQTAGIIIIKICFFPVYLTKNIEMSYITVLGNYLIIDFDFKIVTSEFINVISFSNVICIPLRYKIIVRFLSIITYQGNLSKASLKEMCHSKILTPASNV